MVYYPYCLLDWKTPYSKVAISDDPIIREACYPVPYNAINCKDTHHLIEHIVNTMRKFNLVGLSAPQVGIPLRIIAMEFPPRLIKKIPTDIFISRQMEVLPLIIAINPVLFIKDGKQIISEEKCASLPGYSGDVARFEEVFLIAVNPHGNRISHKLTGWNARIAQHEIDHLNGQLYIDIMDPQSFVHFSDSV